MEKEEEEEEKEKGSGEGGVGKTRFTLGDSKLVSSLYFASIFLEEREMKKEEREGVRGGK